MADDDSLFERIKKWYRGQYVPPPEIDPRSGIIFVSPGYYEQPPLAKVLRWIGHFWLDHWKWIIGTLIAITALVISLSG